MLSLSFSQALFWACSVSLRYLLTWRGCLHWHMVVLCSCGFKRVDFVWMCWCEWKRFSAYHGSRNGTQGFVLGDEWALISHHWKKTSSGLVYRRVGFFFLNRIVQKTEGRTSGLRTDVKELCNTYMGKKSFKNRGEDFPWKFSNVAESSQLARTQKNQNKHVTINFKKEKKRRDWWGNECF